MPIKLINPLGSLLKIAVDRWTAKTPKKAKYIQYGILGLGTGAAVVTLLPQITTIAIPAWIITTCSGIAVTAIQFLKE